MRLNPCPYALSVTSTTKTFASITRCKPNLSISQCSHFFADVRSKLFIFARKPLDSGFALSYFPFPISLPESPLILEAKGKGMSAATHLRGPSVYHVNRDLRMIKCGFFFFAGSCSVSRPLPLPTSLGF